MTRWQRLCSIVVSVSVAIGIVFGFLPRNWIELRLGIAPDGGTGLLELLLILIPVALAVCAAIFVFKPQRGAHSNEKAHSALPVKS
jgi:hypothetical protein